MTPATAVFILATFTGNDPETARDLGLTMAVEGWVKEAHAVKGFEQVLTRPEADLLRRFGCNHYACRAAALRDLEAMPGEPFRLLYYGRLATDRHTREACRALYAERYLCGLCAGSGRCPHASPDRTFGMCFRCNTEGDCPDCDGLGTAARWRRLSWWERYEERMRFGKPLKPR